MEKSEIIGHQRVVGFLTSVHEDENIGHAYLFSGPAQIGKRTVAKWFAEQVTEGVEQNVITLEPEKGLKIADVRSLQHELSLTNPYGKRRVVILGDISEMTPEAQNAFLKTLEEPHGGVTFILLAKSLAGILPTIISRTQLVRFTFVPKQEVEQGLLKQDVDVEKAEQLARLSHGCPGWAMKQAQEPEKFRELEDHLQKIAVILQAKPHKKFDFAKEIVDDNEIDVFLNNFEPIMRDVLLIKQKREAEIIHIFLKGDLKRIAKNSSVDKVRNIIRGSGDLREQLSRNANKRLALENFMLLSS